MKIGEETRILLVEMINFRKNDIYAKLQKGRIFYVPKRQFFWVTNPKVASSSMRAWILDMELGLPDAKTMGPEMASLAIEHLSKKEWSEKWNRYPKICFVRHPVSRFKSAYNNLINRQFRNLSVTAPRPKNQILTALNREGDDINAFVSIDDFISALKRIDPKELDLHFAPQIQSLDPDLINYDATIRLEQLNESLEKLEKDFGISIDLSNYNKKVSKKYEVTLDDDHLEFVVELYKQDFEFLEYPLN